MSRSFKKAVVPLAEITPCSHIAGVMVNFKKSWSNVDYRREILVIVSYDIFLKVLEGFWLPKQIFSYHRQENHNKKERALLYRCCTSAEECPLP